MSRTAIRGGKNFELQRRSLNSSISTKGHACTKQLQNGEHPVHLPSTDTSTDVKCIRAWICKNLACKAVVSLEDSFCKRCSCCICHHFDDNKDPSLWLVCPSENDDKDCCGSSCHIECALQHKKVGCIDLGQIMHLDGSYCCASCGKVSGILGYWKRQLVVAKEARRVDILCYRIYLSYRLLEGTTNLKELHQIIEDAKAKLETEVGPLNGMSAKMARGIVSRLSGGSDVQKLCSLAIERADEWLISQPGQDRKDSLPAACRFKYEDITSSSLVIILRQNSLSTSNTIKGYKFWHWKSQAQPCMEQPVIISKDQRRILVFNLEPCTEYSFRVISFTDDGVLGHSESKCYTGSKELFIKRPKQNGVEGCSSTGRRDRRHSFRSTGFKIRDIGKFLRKAWAEEGYFGGFCEDTGEGSCGGSAAGEQPENGEEERLVLGVSRRLQLNSVIVPDLNIEARMDYSPEETRCNSKNGLIRPNDSGGSETCAAQLAAELPAVESRSENRGKHLDNGHQKDCEEDSTFAICPQKQLLKRPRQLDEDYEYCVKVIRWLECSGHIANDFRLKFLTWLSLRSTEEERRIVLTFIETLMDEPSSLAGQLVESFGEIVSCKRPRNGFCSKLWH